MEFIFYIEPIGLFTLKPKCSFMVDFNMIFIALLYGLGGPDLDREVISMCYTIQAIFCIMCYMCVDDDSCMWRHKNA
jgi:hypothetical protein